MYSSEDLERFYIQYQTEALPHGESLQSFCLKNKVPYNLFEKWYKDTRKRIVEVSVDGRPDDGDEPDEEPGRLARPAPPSPGSVTRVRIWLDLRMSNGLHLSQKDLSNPDRLNHKNQVIKLLLLLHGI